MGRVATPDMDVYARDGGSPGESYVLVRPGVQVWGGSAPARPQRLSLGLAEASEAGVGMPSTSFRHLMSVFLAQFIGMPGVTIRLPLGYGFGRP